MLEKFSAETAVSTTEQLLGSLLGADFQAPTDTTDTTDTVETAP